MQCFLYKQLPISFFKKEEGTIAIQSCKKNKEKKKQKKRDRQKLPQKNIKENKKKKKKGKGKRVQLKEQRRSR